MKLTIFDNTRVVYSSVKVEGKYPRGEWWNDVVKAGIERIEVVLEGGEEIFYEIYKEEKRRVNRSK